MEMPFRSILRPLPRHRASERTTPNALDRIQSNYRSAAVPQRRPVPCRRVVSCIQPRRARAARTWREVIIRDPLQHQHEGTDLGEAAARSTIVVAQAGDLRSDDAVHRRREV
jgi:hypothetical protein